VRRGETPPPAPPAAAGPPGSAAPAGPIDVNRATVAELDELPGVGPATATAIVAHRDEHGPFASVDDLEAVPGIGPAKLAAIRDLVTT
jgi:competence protein ComEA